MAYKPLQERLDLQLMRLVPLQFLLRDGNRSDSKDPINLQSWGYLIGESLDK
jgi:hypothetical protein